MFRRVCQVAVFLTAIAMIIAAAERAFPAPAAQIPQQRPDSRTEGTLLWFRTSYLPG